MEVNNNSNLQERINEFIASYNGKLVLIHGEDERFLIVNSENHFAVLVDDSSFEVALVEQLRNLNTEQFSSFADMEKKYPKIRREKPMFWPEDQLWPYDDPNNIL
jgi:hypothetical protein